MKYNKRKLWKIEEMGISDICPTVLWKERLNIRKPKQNFEIVLELSTVILM